MAEIAIIGGTGVYDPQILTQVRERRIETPFGPVLFQIGVYKEREIAFLARHGTGHSIPPHMVNYRANIWALKKEGVRQIIATTAVGSLNPAMQPGDFVLLHQFLDFTKSRDNTFFTGGERGVVHVDMTEPYCSSLRQVLVAAANKVGVRMHNKGVYVCTEGPRFETPAEIRMFAKLGGDVVGMTGVPEVVLAREAEMCYAGISMVTNFAAGMAGQVLTHGEVLAMMQQNSQNLRKVIMAAVEAIDTHMECTCQGALKEYGGFKL